jgi:hypothetical protein
VKTQLENVDIGLLQTHPRNVRKGNVEAIKESLKAHGQYRPILAQKSTGHIIGGNHTFLAANQLGWSRIDVLWLDVDDDQAMRIMLVDNRTTDLAVTDESALLELLQLLNDTGDMSGTGYDDEDLEDLIFKIEGSLGTITDAVSSTERFDDYLARGVKSIVLPFPAAEYEELLPLLTDLRQSHDVESNSQLFATLVKQAHDARNS